MKATKTRGLQFFLFLGNRMGLQKIKMASRSILLSLTVIMTAFSLMSASCSGEDDETPGSSSNNPGRDVYYDGTIAFTSVGTYEGEVYNESTMITEFKIIPWSAPEGTWWGYDWGFTLEVEVDDVIDTNPLILLKYSGKKRIPEGDNISLHIYKTPGGTYSYNLSLFKCEIKAGDWSVPRLEPPYHIIEGGSLDYDFLPLVIRGETTHFYRNVVPIKTTWELNRHDYKYDGGQALSPLNSKRL